jgi:hypothetical protein
VSEEDRQNVDIAHMSTNEKMRWTEFVAGSKIAWTPIPVTKTTGKTVPVASFDIAVVVGNKVVVFRNQSLFVGNSKQQVVDQGKNYISKVLHLSIKSSDELMFVHQQSDQVTGNLLYSDLAETLSMATVSSSDVALYDTEAFLALREKEDRNLK